MTATIGRPRRSLPERLTGRVIVDFESGCWLWTGTLNKEGYGIVQEGGADGGRSLRVHRAVYELLVGPIPVGLTLDHLCRTRHCVNPAHVEPVTRGENVRRGESPTIVASRENRCVRGHPLTPENTYIRRRRGKVISRTCRTCALTARRERSAA